MAETETMLDAALKYADMGLAVFPLAEGTKIPCIKGGFTMATTDEEQIRAFWNVRPNCNIGIATGGRSNGLVVVDIDLDKLEPLVAQPHMQERRAVLMLDQPGEGHRRTRRWRFRRGTAERPR